MAIEVMRLAIISQICCRNETNACQTLFTSKCSWFSFMYILYVYEKWGFNTWVFLVYSGMGDNTFTTVLVEFKWRNSEDSFVLGALGLGLGLG